MRLNIRTFTLILIAALTIGVSKAQNNNMGIGTATPDASAILELKSTTMGFLMPRMTHAQILAIATPATGLMAYDIDNKIFMYYDGTVWRNIGSNPGPVGPGIQSAAPVGQVVVPTSNAYSTSSTAALVADNASENAIPGLTQKINLASKSTVMVQVSGAATIKNSSNSDLKISVYADGNTAASQTISVFSTNGQVTNFPWSISTSMVLDAGLHTIDVRAIKTNVAAALDVAGIKGSGAQANLVIVVIPE